ncbi:hypothetical protein PNEG_00945 [Pneumocystis murina B123]|uniref:WD repeat-containing protein 75 second beta-propeller domain-containing protein n=1 Tax=Pneumocystis murina (strain B123) TaxID=1069680 RepID=M7NQ28_PNEMU|nr:hypothetical protein PNEG_00945 [Pneumocystis murina B123]EMR10798.1 hypothetical protein PNEG_00945 [Pneumocystis murina B123]
MEINDELISYKEENKEESMELLSETDNEYHSAIDISPFTAKKEIQKKNNIIKKNVKKISYLEWKIQNVAGGSFSDITPIFTKDEKRILIALGSFVKVYDIKTGICIQTIGELDQRNNIDLPKITSMILDPSNEYRIYLSYEEGSIKLWDWTDNSILRCRQTRKKIHTIITSPLDPSSIYAVLENSSDSSNLHNFPISTKSLYKKIYEVYCYTFPSINSNSTKIIRSQRIIKFKAYVGISISHDGKILVIGNTHSIYICKKTNFENKQSSWEIRKFNTGSVINTLVIHDDHVAVGDNEGKLLIYYNILKFEEPIIRTFHWHPQPFSALNWILQGSYILTGGKESVLVFWQLKTGNKQFLPRLGSPIKKIGVSRTNSFYAILLENNSIKIINAIDLKANTEISGVQIGKDISQRLPSIVHPITKNIIFACQSLFSSTFLQSYDIVGDYQVYKTEIIRMFHLETLEKNGSIISKPKITHISLLMDGLWMATVDEWESLNEDYDLYEENTEIYLKFWRWDSTNKKWDLNTRIDSPHGLGKKVNGLHASPNKKKFSTIGSDGSLKIWKLKVKNENATVKTEIWICHKVIRYTRISDDSSKQNEIFCMTWTLDGSMIVLGCRNILLIVNEQLGTICHTVNNLYRGKIIFLQALGAFIIIITKKNILVWDILRATTKWCLDIPKIYQSLKDFCLAADHANQLFAISFNNPKEHNSKLYIFKITSPIPIFLQQHPHRIIALNHVPLNSSFSSFIFLDLSGQFFSLATDDTAFIKKNDSEPIQENEFSLSNIYGASLNRTIKSLPEDDMQFKIVSMETLSFIFDKPAYTMPSLTTLLEETMKWIGEPPLKPFSKTFYSENQKKNE